MTEQTRQIERFEIEGRACFDMARVGTTHLVAVLPQKLQQVCDLIARGKTKEGERGVGCHDVDGGVYNAAAAPRLLDQGHLLERHSGAGSIAEHVGHKGNVVLPHVHGTAIEAVRTGVGLDERLVLRIWRLRLARCILSPRNSPQAASVRAAQR